MDQSNQIPPLQQTQQKSVGPVVGIIIIVIVLIIGALYFWGARLNTETPQDELQTTPLSDSDEVDAISADLSATVINSTVDSNTAAIEGELSQ